MLNEVVQIAVLGRYGLAVRFRDAATLVREEGPMVETLRDPRFFAKARREDGAPTWPNGCYMCPDRLRMKMKTAGELSGPFAAE